MIFYRLLAYAAIPFLLLGLIVKGYKNKGYWQRWGERFGFVPQACKGVTFDVWIHAVSVGEVRAAKPLIERWLRTHPEHKILLTSTTPTGSDMVKMLFQDSVFHCYFPYDIGFFMWRFIRTIQPKISVIMETEIWPNAIEAIKQIGSTLIYVNVRLSERSYHGYARFKSSLLPVLTRIDRFAVQGVLDKSHLIALGVQEKKIVITGSMKFDFNVPSSVKESAALLNHQIGQDRLIWVAGSTREGEEGRILSVHKSLQKIFPNILLILVPRHPERFDSVHKKIVKQGFHCVRRSEHRDVISEQTQVYLGDTMGELLLMYACADVAFVGGSLRPLGGQNILEPCALGVPVLFGPHMFNFPDISKWAEQAGAGFKVKNSQELLKQLQALLANAELRDAMGKKGIQLIEEHSGALEKTYDFIISNNQ